MSVTIEKLKQQLAAMKNELVKVGNQYNEDATITADEQRHIDDMLRTIAMCEAELKKKIAKASQPKMVRYRKFTAPDGKVHCMTEAEYEKFKEGLIKNFKRTHLFALKSRASSARILWDHFKKQNDDQYIVAWFVSFSAGDLPSQSIIINAEKAARSVSKAVKTGNLNKIAEATKKAEKIVNRAIHTMDAYRTKVIDGAGAWVTGLEITATASFAIFMVAGGAVLTAPAIGMSSLGAGVTISGSAGFLRTTASEVGQSMAGINDDKFVSDILLGTIKGMATGAINSVVMAKIAKPLASKIAPAILGKVIEKTGVSYTVEALAPYLEQVIVGSANRVVATSVQALFSKMQGKHVSADQFFQDLATAAIAGGITGLLTKSLPVSRK
jgi:predicted HAD superfamily phosphohydrolase YqeG